MVHFALSEYIFWEYSLLEILGHKKELIKLLFIYFPRWAEIFEGIIRDTFSGN